MSKRAVAYFRTSSLTNVKKKDEEFKDSLNRQRIVIEKFAEENEYTIEHSEYDAGLTGEASISQRDGIQRLISYCSDNNIDTILVENAGRYARNKDVAIKGMYFLEEVGIVNIIFCDKAMNFPKLWKENELEAIMPFLELAFAAKEKRDLVIKLRAARERKKSMKIQLTTGLAGKCEGKKSYAEMSPELVREAKRLRRVNPITGKRRPYRQIAAELEYAGFLDSTGKRLDHGTVRKICMQGMVVKASINSQKLSNKNIVNE